MFSSNSIRIKPPIGRTPRTVGPIGSASSQQQSTDILKSGVDPDRKMSPSEKFQILNQMKQCRGHCGRGSASELLKSAVLAGDEIQDDEENENDGDCGNIMRKLNFDSESIDVNDSADDVIPEYMKKIFEALDTTDQKEVLSLEAYEKVLQKEFGKQVKMNELMDKIEKLMLPALDKLSKDPVRIHEVLKRDRNPNSIDCPVENHENFRQAVTSLSQDTQQLLEFSSVSFDFHSELDNLESTADELDVQLTTKGTEKMKQTRLKKLLSDFKRL